MDLAQDHFINFRFSTISFLWRMPSSTRVEKARKMAGVMRAVMEFWN